MPLTAAKCLLGLRALTGRRAREAFCTLCAVAMFSYIGFIKRFGRCGGLEHDCQIARSQSHVVQADTAPHRIGVPYDSHLSESAVD